MDAAAEPWESRVPHPATACAPWSSGTLAGQMIRPRRDTDLEDLAASLRTVYVSDGYPANWPKDRARWVTGDCTPGAWVSEDRGKLVGHTGLAALDPGPRLA